MSKCLFSPSFCFFMFKRTMVHVFFLPSMISCLSFIVMRQFLLSIRRGGSVFLASRCLLLVGLRSARVKMRGKDREKKERERGIEKRAKVSTPIVVHKGRDERGITTHKENAAQSERKSRRVNQSVGAKGQEGPTKSEAMTERW